MGLAMGIYAGIAAGSVMLLLVMIPLFGWLFSSNKKKAANAEDEEKGEVLTVKPGVVVQVREQKVEGLHNTPSQYTATSQPDSRTQRVR
jgi:hypothetical protein